MVSASLHVVLFAAALVAGGRATGGWKNITVYHVNEASFHAAPVNMNTGSAGGDAYFDLRSTDLPLVCADNASASKTIDCNNAELVGNSIAITKLVLEVDTSRFGAYGYCNVCVNHTDHMGNNSCVDGQYDCRCCPNATASFCDPASMVRCGSSVGLANISAKLNVEGKTCSDAFDCWKINMARKVGNDALWFSTTRDGWCGEGGGRRPPGCTWRVAQVVKRVSQNCSHDRAFAAVEAQDKAGCFRGCPRAHHGAHRNVSDPCWIDCFFSTVLGPHSAKNMTKHMSDTEGMTVAQVLHAWTSPFLSDDPAKGGCPGI